MSVRFKFRSSVTFDSVDIGGRPSMSLRDLKSKIVHKKNLDVCQDFDLVFSDAATGQEYQDENVQISSSSSVIIKRVPVGAMHSDMAHDETLENTPNKELSTVKTMALLDAEVDSCDDFGDELYPLPESTVSISGINRDAMIYLSNGKTSTEASRSFEMPLVGCPKLEASDISDAAPRGPLCYKENRANPSDTEHTKKEKVEIAGTRAMKNASFPLELKCYLCGSFFKEAVMIPCCQHSFCEKCILLALLEKQRCPKCSSTRCTVQDLLPNISLRQAVECFLESQNVLKNSDSLDHHASDGESGIQAKEMPCAVTSHQGKLDLPHSPSDTGRGSNQFIGEPAALFPRKSKHDDGKRGSKDMMADFQGESNPMNDEVDFNLKKKRASWINTAGADKSFAGTERGIKRARTCYMCGSPDHLIRDCPASSSPHATLQTGNAMFRECWPVFSPPCWNGYPFPQFRPFSPYGNPGLIPLNPTMVSFPTFARPACMPPAFGGMAAFQCGFPRMGGVAAPLQNGLDWHMGHLEGWKLRGCEKVPNEDVRRVISSADHCGETGILSDSKSYRCKEKVLSPSEDSFAQSSYRKHQHCENLDEQQRSSSDTEGLPSHGEAWQNHHRMNSEHNGRHDKCHGGYSQSHHQSSREKNAQRKRLECDIKRDKRERHSHGSRYPRHKSRSTNHELGHERWQMVSGSVGDSQEDSIL